jgi:hypothetical protein
MLLKIIRHFLAAVEFQDERIGKVKYIAIFDIGRYYRFIEKK